MAMGLWATLITLKASGTALTAAARASLTQGATASGARYKLPANTLRVGDYIKILAKGRISCAVTTPGTARFDLSLATIANFDTLAMNLNIVAKTNVAWILDVTGRVNETGTTANMTWIGSWLSEAVIGSPLPTVGGSGILTVPYNTPPAAGANFDHTIDLAVDFNFTQTVATGSCTLDTLSLSLMTYTGI